MTSFAEDTDGEGSSEFCRVCRCGATDTQTLFYPCLCTGSIKYIHQDCLIQWLKYSKREYCELCKHKFSFKPIYSKDMPTRLPVRLVATGIWRSVWKAIVTWLHYTLVAIAWLIIVPLTAFRICRCLFTGGEIGSLLTLPIEILSTKGLMVDCMKGVCLVCLTLAVFVSYTWLREQIMANGGPEWLHQQADQPEVEVPAEGVAVNADGPELEQIAEAMNLIPNAFNALVGNNAEADNINEEQIADDGEGLNNNEAINYNEPNMAEDVVVEAPLNNQPNQVDAQAAADIHVLTWDRLLGLDGSFNFVEHIFWVVSLNILFVLTFAFCPYHIGHFTMTGFGLHRYVQHTQMEAVLTTVVGYLVIALVLGALHGCLRVTQLQRVQHYSGLAFLVVKVAFLTVIELGIIPMMCGVWMDVCSLSMFNATITQRRDLFTFAPSTFVFMHWTVGVMFLFYFASFLLVVKDVLRPGVFWFLKNFSDPEFNPIQDMINLPVLRHVRRLIMNCALFGSLIFIMVWIPVKITKIIFPSCLPYIFQSSHEGPFDYSMEMLFLQLIMPMLFDGHASFWIQTFIRYWSLCVGKLTGLHSYLLGDVPFQEGDIIADFDGRKSQLEAVSSLQQHLDTRGPIGNYRPYVYPRKYPILRFYALFSLVSASLITFSILAFVAPVQCGRIVMKVANISARHDLIALLCGLICVAFCAKTAFVIHQRMFPVMGPIQRPQDNERHLVRRMWNRLCRCIFVIWKVLVIFVVVLILVPAILGLLVNFVLIAPFRVPLEKTLLIGFWENWIFGVMHVKVWVMLVLLGPRWWFREELDAIELEVERPDQMRLLNLAKHGGPLLSVLTLCLTAPYCFSMSIAPLLGFDSRIIFRRIYPVLFSLAVILAVIWAHVRQIQRLYEHIKNERYLVGKRLLNYDETKQK